MKWRKGLPEKSGFYVVFTKLGMISTYPYSNKHKAFNAYDSSSEGIVKESNLNYNVEKWVPLEDFIKDQEISYEKTN